jgi:hypothetical protein
MDHTDLSSNWKKLQLTLKEKNAASNDNPTDGTREKHHGLKRKRDDKGTVRTQRVQHRHSKRRMKGTEADAFYSGQDTAAREAHRTIRSIAQSVNSSFAADRVNEGLAQKYVIFKHCLYTAIPY